MTEKYFKKNKYLSDYDYYSVLMHQFTVGPLNSCSVAPLRR